MKESESVLWHSLKETPFFKGLSGDHLQALAGVASVEYFQAGDWIIREGEQADKFYAIVKGSVNVSSGDDVHGGKPVVLQTLGEHEILGWSWIIPPHQWRFDACANEETKVMVFDGNKLRFKFLEDIAFGYELMYRFSFLLSMRLELTRMSLMKVTHKYDQCVKSLKKLQGHAQH